jgi:hypothetical protein
VRLSQSDWADEMGLEEDGGGEVRGCRKSTRGCGRAARWGRRPAACAARPRARAPRPGPPLPPQVQLALTYKPLLRQPPDAPVNSRQGGLGVSGARACASQPPLPRSSRPVSLGRSLNSSSAAHTAPSLVPPPRGVLFLDVRQASGLPAGDWLTGDTAAYAVAAVAGQTRRTGVAPGTRCAAMGCAPCASLRARAPPAGPPACLALSPSTAHRHTSPLNPAPRRCPVWNATFEFFNTRLHDKLVVKVGVVGGSGLGMGRLARGCVGGPWKLEWGRQRQRPHSTPTPSRTPHPPCRRPRPAPHSPSPSPPTPTPPTPPIRPPPRSRTTTF